MHKHFDTSQDEILAGAYNNDNNTAKQGGGWGGLRAKWASTSRRKRILIVVPAVLILLGLVLGLALGLTIGRSSGERSSYSIASNVPTGGMDTSESGFKTNGIYYTSSLDNNSLFDWAGSAPTFNMTVPANLSGYDIAINTSRVYQTMDGFGAALTDASAYLFNELKSSDSDLYGRIFDYTFNRRTGINILRLPLGASDFSFNEYTWADGSKLGNIIAKFGFSAPSYVMSTMRDILERNPDVKVVLSPWTPPPATKTSFSYNGGYLADDSMPTVVEYYAQSMLALTKQGVNVWAFTTQNEPSLAAAYPSTLMSASVQNRLAAGLRGRLGELGLGHVKLFTHDDNYDQAASAYDSVKDNASAVDGLAFHCYKGDASAVGSLQSNLSAAGLSNVEIHLTECTGTQDHPSTYATASQRWSGMSWWLSNVFFPLPDMSARSVLAWNLALDPSSGPHLPAAYCENCTGPYTISSPKQHSEAEQHVTVNLQSYLLQHFSAAVSDLSFLGGGQASRVDTTTATATSAGSGSAHLGASQLACLTAQAYAAPWSGTDLAKSSTKRIGLVVQNSCQDTLSARIALDGSKGANASLRPGLTTLVWTV